MSHNDTPDRNDYDAFAWSRKWNNLGFLWKMLVTIAFMKNDGHDERPTRESNSPNRTFLDREGRRYFNLELLNDITLMSRKAKRMKRRGRARKHNRRQSSYRRGKGPARCLTLMKPVKSEVAMESRPLMVDWTHFRFEESEPWLTPEEYRIQELNKSLDDKLDVDEYYDENRYWFNRELDWTDEIFAKYEQHAQRVIDIETAYGGSLMQPVITTTALSYDDLDTTMSWAEEYRQWFEAGMEDEGDYEILGRIYADEDLVGT